MILETNKMNDTSYTVEKFKLLRELFRTSPLFSDIKKWENREISGKELDNLYKNINYDPFNKPKGMHLDFAKLTNGNPLFTEFVENGMSIGQTNLKPDYIEYGDKKTDYANFIIIRNNKSAIENKGGAMSYVHLLGIPKSRKYNALSLENEDIEFLKNIIQEMRKTYREAYPEIIGTFLSRAFLKKYENSNIYVVNQFEDLKFSDDQIQNLQQELFETGIKVRNDTNNGDNKQFTKNLILAIRNNRNLDELRNLHLQIKLHVHPNHSIGHLHIHGIIEELSSPFWSEYINETVDVENVLIPVLENESDIVVPVLKRPKSTRVEEGGHGHKNKYVVKNILIILLVVVIIFLILSICIPILLDIQICPERDNYVV